MEQAVRQYEIARRLLALETGQSEQTDAGVSAALSAFAKLHAYLIKLVGVAGFQVLLARALALAKAEAGWLEPVRVQADATLEGFSEAAQRQPAETTAEGGAALLAQLLGLLVTFIGESLTLRLMQDVWPEAQLDEINSGAEETPA